MAKQVTIPGGDDKGKTPEQLTDNALTWWAENAKFADVKAACNAEIERRAKGGKPAPPPAAAPQGAGLARTAPTSLVMDGAFADAGRATQALQNACQVAHLVAPAPVCGSLPDGCELALAAVLVDPETETYKIAGKHGLAKVALDKIAGAAGVTWDPRETRRLDDGSDPHYCHFRAVMAVRSYDGQLMIRTGEVEIDAREGSPLLDEIREKAARANPPRDPAGQVLELRKFLLRHAESKAKNRAIRSLGVRTSYSAEELKKPFAVAKVIFTGRTNDPEARKVFRGKIADAFLGASSALYSAPAPALAAPAPYHAPPPTAGSSGGYYDDDAHETHGEPAPDSSPAATAQPADGTAQQTTLPGTSTASPY